MKRRRFLLAANGADLAQATLATGPRLTLDAATERFGGAHGAHANLMLRDTYREPFVIRDTV